MSSTVSTDLSPTPSFDECDRLLLNSSHLCHHCRSIGHEIRKLCMVKNFSVSMPDSLVKKGRSTCSFCRMIDSKSRLRIDESGENFIIHNKLTRRNCYSSPPTDGINDLTVEYRNRSFLLSVFTTEGSTPAIVKHVSGRCIKASSDLSRAKGWLNDCLGNHDHGPKIATFRPSRLVAVGTMSGSEPIKIVDDSDPGNEYLALSYCWGSSNPLRTTSETLDKLRQSIPWDQLPKTFQDAIQIARDLGIGHVWIDSLCIIQGDLDDWVTESAKMAGIYHGALFTIMAASASDSHGGCFQDHTALKEMVALPYTDSGGVTKLSVFVCPVLPGYEQTVAAGPLFKRGWVFQERMMSKRKLIFGKDQTYWECNSSVLSESNISNRDKFAYLNRQRNEAFRTFSDPSYQMDRPGGSKPYAELWVDLVREYSQCSLKYDTDRLPSLSGIARVFAQKSGGSYVAGLWLDQMPRSLIWYVSNMQRESCRRNYCAPSWSWVSVMNEVYFRSEDENYELEVVSTDIRLASRDPFGAVRPGSSIGVRGRLRTATLVRIEGKDRPMLSGIEDETQIRLDRNDEDFPLDTICLEVSSKAKVLGSDTRCLLLKETAKHKTFRRIGLAERFQRGQDFFHGLEKQTITLI